jgi:hypothetical protein
VPLARNEGLTTLISQILIFWDITQDSTVRKKMVLKASDLFNSLLQGNKNEFFWDGWMEC